MIYGQFFSSLSERDGRNYDNEKCIDTTTPNDVVQIIQAHNATINNKIWCATQKLSNANEQQQHNSNNVRGKKNHTQKKKKNLAKKL